MSRRALRWNEQKGASLEWAEGRFAGMSRRALRWNGQRGASLEWAGGRFARMVREVLRWNEQKGRWTVWKVDGLNSPACNFDQIFTRQVSPPPMILASDCPDSGLCPAREPK